MDSGSNDDTDRLPEENRNRDREEQNSSERVAEVERITDQAALIEIAMNENDNVVREAAVWRVEDQAALIKIAEKTCYYQRDYFENVRKAAVALIDDPEELLYFEMMEPWGDLRDFISTRLKSYYTTIVTQYTHPGILKAIARHAGNKHLKACARERIQDIEKNSGQIGNTPARPVFKTITFHIYDAKKPREVKDISSPKGLIRIGRFKDNEIRLKDGKLPPVHAEIVTFRDGPHLLAWSHKVPMYLNGEPIEEVKKLVPGDTINLGKSRIVLKDLSVEENKAAADLKAEDQAEAKEKLHGYSLLRNILSGYAPIFGGLFG